MTPNGPLLVSGNVTVKRADGTETKHHKVTAFCRCGASGNKRYCDGTHRKVGFTGRAPCRSALAETASLHVCRLR